MAFIFVATCTSDPHAFLFQHVVSFKIDSSPVFADLLIIGDIPLQAALFDSKDSARSSALGLLLYSAASWDLTTCKIAFVISGLYAFTTEVLQLYFNRSGRLVDVGIDLVGIYLAYLLCKAFSKDIILNKAHEDSELV